MWQWFLPQLTVKNPGKCGKSVERDQKHVTDKSRKVYIFPSFRKYILSRTYQGLVSGHAPSISRIFPDFQPSTGAGITAPLTNVPAKNLKKKKCLSYLCGVWESHLWQTWPDFVVLNVPEYSLPCVVVLQKPRTEGEIFGRNTDFIKTSDVPLVYVVKECAKWYPKDGLHLSSKRCHWIDKTWLNSSPSHLYINKMVLSQLLICNQSGMCKIISYRCCIS